MLNDCCMSHQNLLLNRDRLLEREFSNEICSLHPNDYKRKCNELTNGNIFLFSQTSKYNSFTCFSAFCMQFTEMFIQTFEVTISGKMSRDNGVLALLQLSWCGLFVSYHFRKWFSPPLFVVQKFVNMRRI